MKSRKPLFLTALCIASMLCGCQTKQKAALSGELMKIEPAEIKDNPFTLIKDGWWALSTGDEQTKNAMTVSWGGMGILWGRPVITVYVSTSRFTHSLMEQNDYFTVCSLPEENRPALQYLGTSSGRNEDKFAGSGLTVLYTENGTPYFGESRLVIECRKIYSAPFDAANILPADVREMYSSGRMGIHTIYVGEIVSVLSRGN